MSKKLIHKLIKNSELSTLKINLDTLQLNLLSFDDPSLIVMAMEIYLNPNKLGHHDFQIEMLIFLSKCGLKLYLPGGGMVLYLWQFYQPNNKKEEAEENARFSGKIMQVIDHLSEHHADQILQKTPTREEIMAHQDISDHLERNQSAIIIQRWFRSKNN